MSHALLVRSRLAIVSTGGTIEKTYDVLGGVLANALAERVSVLDVMLSSLELGGVKIERISLMDKDSLEMTPEDHESIAGAVETAFATNEAVIVVHGTDRLAVSGERILARLSAHGALPGPVVLTGAMRPYELRTTDAMQNLTESLLAARVLPPGVYCVMHNEVLAFPGVYKDRAAGRFRRQISTEPKS